MAHSSQISMQNGRNVLVENGEVKLSNENCLGTLKKHTPDEAKCVKCLSKLERLT